MTWGTAWNGWCLTANNFGVPQSRRRLFLICYLDPRCAGKIFPVFGTGGKALIQVLGGSQGSRVYDADGIACTQTAGAGGVGGKTGLYIIPQDRPFVDLCAGEARQTESARCLTARYGQTTLSNHRAERSGVLLIKEATEKKAIKRRIPVTASISAFPGAIPAVVVWDRISHTHWRRAASRASWNVADASGV